MRKKTQRGISPSSSVADFVLAYWEWKEVKHLNPEKN